MRSLLCLTLLLLPLSGFSAEPGKISTTGVGTITFEPDQGYITVGCSTVRQTAPTALTENSMTVKRMLTSVEKLGVAQRDIKTLRLSIDEHHTNDGRRTTADGYEATNLIRITVCDLKNFGQILEATVTDGANRVQSINFGSSTNDVLTKKARAAAVQDAIDKAKTIADALGVKIGVPDSVEEQQGFAPREAYYGRSLALDAASGGAPVSGGELSVSVQVRINWTIAPGDVKQWGK